MNGNTKSTKVFSIILIILITAAQIVVFLTPEADIYMKAAAAVATVALICAFIYALTGFGKKGAAFYGTYLLLYALAEIAELVNLLMSSVDTISGQPLMILFTSATIIALFVLALMKDVGKKISFIIVTVIVIGNIISAFVAIITSASGGAIVGVPVTVIRAGQRILLAAVAYLLVQAKYADKDARGTK
ncbi:MAG: hypothetical protein Q4E54_03765 [Lachnospiraceae bacterium]|nr:hypothetical protein [Lachnospiraceae bacterium]